MTLFKEKPPIYIKMHQVYTDGSCLGNPGPGGWAWFCPTEDKSGSGMGSLKSTNNTMEIQACIEALKVYPGAEIVTDSSYVKQGITTWITKWMRNGWKTAAGGQVKNQELWEKLYLVSRGASWKWVKAHSKDPHNNFVDKLARDEATTSKGLESKS